jgi:hypothetical protein
MSDTNNDATANRPRRKVSAFALAKIDFSVHAQIGMDDVQALRPNWSEQEAQAFLREHGHTEMAMAGAAVLTALIGGAMAASTETEADNDPVVVVEMDDAFHIRDEGSANWVLRKIVECRAYRERVARWAQEETLRAERQEAFLMHRFGNELEAWAREQIYKQHGRRRSIALPAGVLGLRREPTKLLVVDERALAGWCRTHLPATIKVTETPQD